MKNRIKPARAVKPGTILRNELDTRGWTQIEFAEIIGRPVQAINEILSGKKAITPETALEISNALGTSPELWLNLETSYRLHLADRDSKTSEEIALKSKLYSLAPIRELQIRGIIDRTNNLDILQKQVLGFFNVQSLESEIHFASSYRLSNRDEADRSSVLAWLQCAANQAGKMYSKEYSHRDMLSFIPSLSHMSENQESTAKVPEVLADRGIKLAFVKHFPRTYLDGAAFWMDKTPVIALSLRYDRLDYFWFTLMHELAHIIEDGGRESFKDPHYDENMFDPANFMNEEKANTLAQNWLVDSSRLKTFIAVTDPYYSKGSIVAFSKQLGVHPSIIVGRLQHEGKISFTHLRALHKKARHLFMG